MKKAGFVSSVFVTLLLTAFTVQNIWKSDKAHSELGFSIKHLGISEVSGTFNDFEATVKSSKADFSDAVVEAAIQVASVDTRIGDRDNHLRSADFFDAEKYPQITFKSTGIKSTGKDKYRLTGNLTAKGITKQVELDLTHEGTIEHPMSKKPTAGFKLTGVIKRSDFGIGTAFPAPMLSDEVTLTVNAEIQR
ncbi:MAG: YceI family protein [Leadbetterella sp.]|nr:YceI family protein [Leadbetterella sp.]